LYVTIGEFVAFIIGWNVILEYVIGTSTTASALSKYIDSLANEKISHAFRAAMPMDAEIFAQYPG
jgi:cationic amino acid transporter 14